MAEGCAAMSVSLDGLNEAFTKLFTESSTLPKSVEHDELIPDQATPPSSPLECAFEKVDYSTKGYHANVTVRPSQVVDAASVLDQNGFGIDTVTGVDWIADEQMEVVYDFFHPIEPWRVVVRTRVPRAAPELPTISEVFPGANWHERETHDFFGIRFSGHPDLSPFLLPEDADFHPLRKDFQT